MNEDERVSLLEIFEVRAAGFSSAELIAIIFSAADHLLASPERGLFSPHSVYISFQGKIKASFPLTGVEFLEEVPFEFVPPEVQANPHGKIGDPQAVWTLGEIVRGLSQHDCADANLFSMINLMTANDIGTRPSVQYLRQLVKNKLANPEGVPNLLLSLYQEVMGDVEQLADDSDTESMITTNDPRQAPFGTKVAQMTRASTSVSSTPAGSTTSQEELQSRSSSLDEDSLVDTKEMAEDVFMDTETPTRHQPVPVVAAVVDDASSLSRISEESAVTRSRDSPMDVGSSSTSTPVEPSENIRFVPEVVEKKELENEKVVLPTPVIPSKRPSRPPVDITHQSNQEPVEVEIHHEPSRSSSPVPARPRYERNKPKDPPIVHHNRAFELEERRPSRDFPAPVLPTAVAHEQPAVSARTKARESPALSRHNSLRSSQIQRKSTTQRMPRKPVAIPEFVEKRTLPTIRLRAQSQKKKRMTLHRVENTIIRVQLLNGQSMELNCRSDVLVRDIFDTVVAHLNISEHSFFGLAIVKNDEFFFLEHDHRLEKFAPAGWKYTVRNGVPTNFSLFLRFKFYPKRTEFIRTDITMHELYLQLRQDILQRSLIGARQQAFEAGAVALQAEYGDSVQGVADYFDVNNYLPSSLLAESGGAQEARQELIRRHKNLNGYKTERCERMFIRLCQTFHSFGAHFYSVHKFKPSAKADERNARFQDLQTIAILPTGLGICKDSRNINSTYEWHFIRTLQYDGKRFLISTMENNVVIDHVFYTDHFTKSRYLVRFAAEQHKFMMRMRQWQSTLTRSRMPLKDVDVDMVPHFQTEPSGSPMHAEPTSPNDTLERSDGPSSADNELTADSIKRTYGEDASILTFCIEKHPTRGLGLTLVDGNVNGVKGVFVKSLAPDGDGKRKGLHMGDCILKLQGESLCNKSRHDAVELVKLCEHEVHLEVLRFNSITAVLGVEVGNPILPSVDHRPKNSIDSSTPSSADLRLNKPRALNRRADDLSSLSSERSRQTHTPPPQRKSQSSTAVLVQRRQRAVSDFGAVGDTLPKMNSDYLLASMEKIPRADASDSSDDERTENKSDGGQQPISSIYKFEREPDETSPTADRPHANHTLDSPRRPSGGGLFQQRGKTNENSRYARANGTSKKNDSTLDWTDEHIRSEDAESESTDLLTIQLHRIPGHSLGFRVASANGRVYVKLVNAEPALSAGIRPNDRIISINGQQLDGVAHPDVVNLLRDGGHVIRLVIERTIGAEQEEVGRTIAVLLDKSQSSVLGLSLAKKMGQEGIFIRSIAPGSLADQEGSLRVGDQLLKLDGEEVGDESPTAIVDRLRQISGQFEIVVRRNEST